MVLSSSLTSSCWDAKLWFWALIWALAWELKASRKLSHCRGTGTAQGTASPHRSPRTDGHGTPKSTGWDTGAAEAAPEHPMGCPVTSALARRASSARCCASSRSCRQLCSLLGTFCSTATQRDTRAFTCSLCKGKQPREEASTGMALSCHVPAPSPMSPGICGTSLGAGAASSSLQTRTGCFQLPQTPKKPTCFGYLCHEGPDTGRPAWLCALTSCARAP